MQIFLWLTFLLVLGVAIFAVQNAAAPPVPIKFLFWSFETSLIPMILGSVGSGMLIILLLWVPRALRSSSRVKAFRKEIEHLQAGAKHPVGETGDESKKKAP